MFEFRRFPWNAPADKVLEHFLKPLERKDLHQNPFVQFSSWFDEARRALGIRYPSAFCLSTLDPEGYPNGRMLLMKDFTEAGFTFFTNRKSVKAQSLIALPKAGMTFYWDALRRQVRIQGDVTECDSAEDDEYFRTRDRRSQLGAWASMQSSELDSRQTLEERISAFDLHYGDGEVPRPPYWGGYCLQPVKMEFWQERPNRLHDRFAYIRVEGDRWNMRGLYP